MSREQIDDPEILADLYKRASSERDATRTAQDPTLTWTAPEYIEGWTCRARCGRFVPVTPEALGHWADANRALVRLELEPLGKHEVLFCPACKARAAPDRSAALRRRSDEQAALIRELKTLVDNDLRERGILARLRDLGHPDVDGLRKAIADGRAAKTTTTKRRTI